MIKPHGSDQLNPLYVRDDAKRSAFARRGSKPPLAVTKLRRGRQCRDVGRGLLQPPQRLYEPR